MQNWSKIIKSQLICSASFYKNSYFPVKQEYKLFRTTSTSCITKFIIFLIEIEIITRTTATTITKSWQDALFKDINTKDELRKLQVDRKGEGNGAQWQDFTGRWIAWRENKQTTTTIVYSCAWRVEAEAMKEKFNDVVYDKSFVNEHQIVMILFWMRCAATIAAVVDGI